MNSIDPNAVLFQQPLSSSASSPEAKTPTGFSAPTRQENSHDFETLLAKISQDQGNQEQHKSLTRFATLASKDELSNTMSASQNTSVDNVSHLAKASENTIIAKQHSSFVSDTIIVSVSNNKSMANIQKSNLNNLNFPITSEDTSSLYDARSDSGPKNSNSSSLSNFLLSSFATPATGPIFPMALPATSVSNDPSNPISSKSTSQPVLGSSSLSTSMGEKNGTVLPSALSDAFAGLAQTVKLRILDVQNHWAPMNTLSQSLQLENTVKPQDPSANFEQSAIKPHYNMYSFNSNLKPNLKGVASNNVLSQSVVDAASSEATALDRPALEAVTTAKPLNQSPGTYSSSVLSFRQAVENSSDVNLFAARSADTLPPAVYFNSSSRIQQDLLASEGKEENVDQTTLRSTESKQKGINLSSDPSTHKISEHPLTKQDSALEISTYSGMDAGEAKSQASTVLNPFPFGGNITPPSNVQSEAPRTTYPSQDSSFEIESRVLQQSPKKLKYNDGVSLLKHGVTSMKEVSQSPSEVSAHVTAVNTLAPDSSIQSSLEELYSETYGLNAGLELNQHRTFGTIGVVSPNTANEKNEIKLDISSKPIKVNHDFVPNQGLGSLAKVQSSTTTQTQLSNVESPQVLFSLHMRSDLISQSSVSQNLMNPAVDRSMQSSPFPKNSGIDEQGLSLSTDTVYVGETTTGLTSNVPFSAEPKLYPVSNHSAATQDVSKKTWGAGLTSPGTRLSMKKGILDSSWHSGGNETENVNIGQFGEYHFQTSISNEPMTARANSSSVAHEAKNSDVIFRQGTQFGSLPDAVTDQEAQAISAITDDQNRADLLPKIAQQPVSKSQNQFDVIANKTIIVSQSALANLPADFSPIDQITKCIKDSVSNIVTPGILSNPNLEQPQGLILSSGIKTLNLALDPHELGNINVKLRLSASGLDMHLEASSPETAQLIDRDKGKLLKGLQDSGYLVDTIVVKPADNQTTVLQQGIYGDSGKAAVESNQTESPAAGLNLHQENSNANNGAGSENSNHQKKSFELDSGSDDVRRSSSDGDLYI